MVTISIITVSYNSATTIAETLESIARQDYANFEHLVIDGGSTDGTLEIVRAWEKHAIRLVSEPDEGLYDAMNKGLVLASGDVIGFLNSDDFYSDASVLKRIAGAFQDDSIQAVYADLIYVSQNAQRVVRYWRSNAFRNGAFGLGWSPAHPTFYVRKAVVAEHGLFDRSFRLAADVDLMMRYLELGRVKSAYVPHVLVSMRLGGKTNQSLKNVFMQNKEVLTALKKRKIPYSTILFAGNKIINRLKQFVSGYIRQF
jgi:glycosyltransferase involved in cell wall biosynthesis